MNPSELRIGNFVLFANRDDIYRIISIDYDGIVAIEGIERQDCDGTYDVEIIKSIPLTEEWLIKLGYLEDLSTKEAGLNYSIWFERRGSELLLVNTEKEIVKEFEFVHTYQNALFALTGEEITIKE